MKEDKEENSGMLLGMLLGLAIGTAVGSATGQLATGMTTGMALGLAVGLTFDRKKKPADGDGEKPGTAEDAEDRSEK